MDEAEKRALFTQASAETLQIMANNISQLFWTATPQGNISSINDSWFQYTGLTVEQTQNEGVSLVLHPDDLAWYPEELERVLKAGKPYAMEYRIRPIDGIYRWFLCRAIPVHDEKGNITHWFGTCIDIDDIKRIEADLRAKTAQLDFALNSAGAGAWSWDVANDKITWNRKCFALFGEDFQNNEIHPYEYYLNRIHPDDRAMADTKVKQALAGKDGGEYSCEYRVVWPDNNIHILCARGRAYFDEFGKPVQMIGVCWDVTQQRIAEKKLHELQIEFARATNNSVIGETASALAHELNQPLTVISTYSQLANTLLNNNDYSSAELSNALQQITKQSERAGTIIHRMKDLAGSGALYLEPVDLNKIVCEAVDFVHHEKFNLTPCIEFDLSTNIPNVLLDRVQIQQVIINLVKNSIEAMRNAQTKSAKIIIKTFMKYDNIVAVMVSDNGPGIPVEMRDKLFDHTFTTKTSGMGIGLIICRNIVEAHGGQLIFCPTEGEAGACFELTLPLIS